MIVVWYAEFARSYIAQARRSRRPSPRRLRKLRMSVFGCPERRHSLKRLPRDPLTKERVHDDVSRAFASEDIFSNECRERRLNRRGSAQAVSRTDVRGQQFAAILEDRRTQGRPLAERETLPHALENRLVL